jgi:hypothetical protein
VTDLPNQAPATIASPRKFPPVAELATGSLAVIVVGGIDMAASFPQRPDLVLPIALLAISAALLAAAVVLLLRWRPFAWATFSLVARWALLAYVISAGMIEFSFDACRRLAILDNATRSSGGFTTTKSHSRCAR